MFKIKQYRPSFFTGFEDKIAQFETIDDFLRIDFVQNFSCSDKSRYISEGFFVDDFKMFILHKKFNVEENEEETWGVARILSDNGDELQKLFYNKWNIKSNQEMN